MECIFAPEPFEVASTPSIFLAAPNYYRDCEVCENRLLVATTAEDGHTFFRDCQACTGTWCKDALKYLEQARFAGRVYVPGYQDLLGSDDAISRWRFRGMQYADAIAFWMPETSMTGAEFGKWVDSRRVVLGHPKGTPDRYLDWLADFYNTPIRHTLHETLDVALEKCAAQEENMQ